MHVHRTHLRCRLPRYPVRQIQVEGTCQSDIRRINRIVRRIGIPVDRIYTEYYRYRQTALHRQGLEIIRFLYGQDMKERAYKSLLRPFRHGIGIETRIEGIGRIVLQVFLGQARLVFPDVFQSHELVHLSYLLFEGHSR